MQLDCGACVVRDWKRGDEWDLVQSANNPNVSRYLTDRFPSPYTLADAYAWIDLNEAKRVASARVLEKAGYLREGIMRSAVVKRGEVHDLFLYAMVR